LPYAHPTHAFFCASWLSQHACTENSFVEALRKGAERFIRLTDLVALPGVGRTEGLPDAFWKEPADVRHWDLPVRGQHDLIAVAFSANLKELYRLDAEYIDKIPRGAYPGDLPIEEPRQRWFIVNTWAARALRLTFPPDAAAQVTQWIEP
jgi:putative ABC transport system substrate-binding protein